MSGAQPEPLFHHIPARADRMIDIRGALSQQVTRYERTLEEMSDGELLEDSGRELIREFVALAGYLHTMPAFQDLYGQAEASILEARTRPGIGPITGYDGEGRPIRGPSASTVRAQISQEGYQERLRTGEAQRPERPFRTTAP